MSRGRRWISLSVIARLSAVHARRALKRLRIPPTLVGSSRQTALLAGMLCNGKRIQGFATGAIWSWLAAACLWKLRAGTTNVAGFSSDSAIPVLMANDRHWDLFQCFFYGQDRFGARPFLLMRIAGLVESWRQDHFDDRKTGRAALQPDATTSLICRGDSKSRAARGCCYPSMRRRQTRMSLIWSLPALRTTIGMQLPSGPRMR